MASNGVSCLEQLVDVMLGESTQGLQSDLLEKIRTSDIRISCRITEVRLEKARATTITIKPRNIGTNQEGWQIGEKEIPCDTLDEAIIVAIEIINRG